MVSEIDALILSKLHSYKVSFSGDEGENTVKGIEQLNNTTTIYRAMVWAIKHWINSILFSASIDLFWMLWF